MAASGGEDDLAYLWNTQTGEIIRKLDGFKDSVVHIGFSKINECNYLAVADMSGLIKVYKINNGDNSPPVFEFEIGEDVTWMGFHPSANVLFAATADSGSLWMWKIPGGESKIYPGHGERAEMGAVLADGRKAAVGYGDGQVKVFDLKTGETVAQVKDAHQSAVSSLAVKDVAVIASGGVDGIAKLLNTQNGATLQAFNCKHHKSSDSASGSEDMIDSESAVEAVVFTDSYLITGSLEGMINVWDVSAQQSRLAVNVGAGIVKLAKHKTDSNVVLAGTLEGLVKLVDVRTGKILCECSGHKHNQAVLDFSQSQDGNLVLTSSDDGHCKIFDLSKITNAE